jgi:hypothetical protein
MPPWLAGASGGDGSTPSDNPQRRSRPFVIHVRCP